MSDGVWRDEERLPLAELNQAMATYSGDGQVDDTTGNDVGAELAFGEGAFVHGDPANHRPSPDGRIGPH